MAAAEEKTSIIRNRISISYCTRGISKIISGGKTCPDDKRIEEISDGGDNFGEFGVKIM
jgi:hypothetical protein